MQILWSHIFILFPAGILAGIVGSIAGLASLVSYPALLAVGIPPVLANITNTAALVFSGIGSTISSKRELSGHKKDLLRLLPLTVGGSIFGGLLLLIAPVSAFEHVVPFFILGSAILILRPELLHFNRNKQQSVSSITYKRILKVSLYVAIFLVGAYTGYFGAAGGVIMLALLAATSDIKFTEYNALKNVSLGACNLAATILFVFRSHIYWLAAAPLAVGFFIGGFIGPYIVRYIPAKLLRILIACGAIGLALYLFIETYLG
ncbi:sulfite exporter TauE/SafE family protein [Clostridium tyrobutyricum]|uniref:sulfite exporter TauE/SafE family protein n=1 Tax=Clostridium tyrobutyricum TaxID=1519 RepID=UPI001C3903C2|nr:sulfite exporter TauE/SafE family protein [Clostridium tyrobutyricum]MBV4419805.1 sulfite exporter TauE/SafE family protein [Clostridium tyrobutyricum]